MDFTTSEVAKMLRVSSGRVRQLKDQGVLVGGVHRGNTYFFPKKSLIQLIENRIAEGIDVEHGKQILAELQGK